MRVLGLWLGCLWYVQSMRILGAPSSKADPPLPSVPVAECCFASVVPLTPVSSLYPPCHSSSLHFYLPPPGSLLASQLVSRCLYSLHSSLFLHIDFILIFMLLSCFKTTTSCSLSMEFVNTCQVNVQSSFPMDPHATDNTDYTWLLNAAVHLHAFLPTVLSFRMIPLHFCPVNFHSSFVMHHRGCLLHAAFLILPTSFHFTFPRTSLSLCSTIGLVSQPFMYMSSCLTLRASATSHPSLQLQGSTASCSLWHSPLTSFTS